METHLSPPNPSFNSDSFLRNPPDSLRSTQDLSKSRTPTSISAAASDVECFVPVLSPKSRRDASKSQRQNSTANSDLVAAQPLSRLEDFPPLSAVNSNPSAVISGRRVLQVTNPAVKSTTSQVKSLSQQFISGQFNHTARTWKDVVSDDQIPISTPLQFFPPIEFSNQKCAQMTNSVKVAARNQWSNSLVIYVVGSKPYFQYFKDYIHRVWNPLGDFQIYSKENGFFVIRFEKEEDCTRILEEGPYYYGTRLVMMKRWTPGMRLNKELLKSVPVWVRFPGLHLDYWSEEGISRIASVLGRPIKMDKYTKGLIKISFARVLIEISSDSCFPSQVPILNENGEIEWQAVEYEWSPTKCSNCSSFGHNEKYCVFQKIWVPKSTAKQDMEVDSLNNLEMVEPQKEEIIVEESENMEAETLQERDKIQNMEMDERQVITFDNNIEQHTSDGYITQTKLNHENSLDESIISKSLDNSSSQNPTGNMSDNGINVKSVSTKTDGNIRKKKEKSIQEIYADENKENASSMDKLVIDNPGWAELTKLLKSKSKTKLSKKQKGNPVSFTGIDLGSLIKE